MESAVNSKLPASRSASRTPTRKRRKEDRPAEITAAALGLFLQHGFAATRTDDVAAESGVSKGTVYLYFPTKEDLFRAVIRQSIEPLLTQAEITISEYTGSARDLLADMLRKPFHEQWDEPTSGIGKMMMAEAHHFPNLSATYVQELVSQTQSILESVLNYGVNRGEFCIADVPYTARALLALLDYPQVWRHSIGKYESEPLDPQRYANLIISLLLNGISAVKETSDES